MYSPQATPADVIKSLWTAACTRSVQGTLDTKVKTLAAAAMDKVGSVDFGGVYTSY